MLFGPLRVLPLAGTCRIRHRSLRGAIGKILTF